MYSHLSAKIVEQPKGPDYVTLVHVPNTFGTGPVAGEESVVLFYDNEKVQYFVQWIKKGPKTLLLAFNISL